MATPAAHGAAVGIPPLQYWALTSRREPAVDNARRGV